MSDYSFTNRPNLATGIYGHHLLTQATIRGSTMLEAMHGIGIDQINFRDFYFNGAPLTGSIAGGFEVQGTQC